MSGIARILVARRHGHRQRRGSDRVAFAALRAPRRRVLASATPRTDRKADTVIASTAIKAENPELVAARGPACGR